MTNAELIAAARRECTEQLRLIDLAETVSQKARCSVRFGRGLLGRCVIFRGPKAAAGNTIVVSSEGRVTYPYTEEESALYRTVEAAVRGIWKGGENGS